MKLSQIELVTATPGSAKILALDRNGDLFQGLITFNSTGLSSVVWYPVTDEPLYTKQQPRP